MSYAVQVTIKNPYPISVKCTDISCKTFDGNGTTGVMAVGSTIEANGSGVYYSTTSDRLFCTWQNANGGSWQFAMTSPQSSHNSACACSNDQCGLQTYARTGNPAVFTFILGQANLADWDSGTENNGDTITYGDC